MQKCQYTRVLHIASRIYGLSYIIICYRIFILKIWWKLLTWLLIRGEAKNVFTKVFRLVSAEVSIYTGFTNNRIYGLSYIIICYRIYIEKKQDIRSRAAPVRSKSPPVWDPRESGIPGREWIPDSDPGIPVQWKKGYPFYSSTGTVLIPDGVSVWDPRESGIPQAGNESQTRILGSTTGVPGNESQTRLGSERMNPRRESGMETTTKTGIEKVEDCYRSKKRNKTNRRPDSWWQTRQTDRQATAVETYIGN